MRERKELKLGEYVVITETNPDFNYEVKHYGKLITIDTDRGYHEAVQVIIKRSAIRSGEHHKETFTFKRGNFPYISIRLMEFSEMSTWTMICWFFRNVVFPLRYPTTFKPATAAVDRRPEEEKGDKNVILA